LGRARPVRGGVPSIFIRFIGFVPSIFILFFLFLLFILFDFSRAIYVYY